MSPSSASDLATAAQTVFTKPFDGLIRLEPEGDPPLWIDGRCAPPQAGAAPPDDAGNTPTCVIRASRETLTHILEGERLLAGAFVSGRLSIAGDMSIMTRLLLERSPRA